MILSAASIIGVGFLRGMALVGSREGLSTATTPQSASASSKAFAAFGGKSVKDRTTRPLFSEYPASLPPGEDFTFTPQIALSIGMMVVQLVKL